MIQKLLVIPDCQVKPGVKTDHLSWIGNYVKDKRPEAIVNLGDFWDMQSLSSYDRGKRAAENRRLHSDIRAGNEALRRLSSVYANIRSYTPKQIILRGNHEQRLERYCEDHPELTDTVGYHLFDDKKLGWEPKPFLAPVYLVGILFSHFFPRGANGRITQTKRGAPSARLQCIREGCSTVAGHMQGLDTAIIHQGSRTLRGIIAGSCYTHSEEYLSPQGQNHWRGVLMLHQVKNGNFSICEVDLNYLESKYG